jgi:hypothetical protein
MVFSGRVQNGVVVLNDGVRLPEGQEVTVIASVTVPAGSAAKGPRTYSVLDIESASVDAVLRPLTSDDDLLGELLEGRP